MQRRPLFALSVLNPGSAPPPPQVLTGKKARRQRQAAMRERLNAERLESMEAVGITPGFWGWLGRTLGMKMPDAGDGEGKSQ